MRYVLMLFFASALLAGVYLLGVRRGRKASVQAEQPDPEKGHDTESQADGPAVVDQFLYDRCCRYMAERKPFLVESFTLADLSRALYTNRVYLSKTINYFSGKN